MAISFRILARARTHRGRLGRVETPHGGFDTPAFMPVATAAAMKGLTPAQVRGTGSQIILNNAYHLLVRVGVERMRAHGGSHRFMRWDGPMLTDSGGFQAYSMGDIVSLDEAGVTFRSFVDGAKIRLGPKESMDIQGAIGADIVMAFDDCPPGEAEPTRRRAAHERTLRWLAECVRHRPRPDLQALFGIVQGGTDLDLRRASVEGVCAHDLPGYAIGGVAVGEGPEEIRRVVEFTAPLLPEDRPRYLMGVGYERDIVTAVAAGIDMFDCVLPTRNGRNAFAFTRRGALRLRNARFALDAAPIEEDCDCETCRGGFSRAYLRYLFAAEEMLGPTLVSLHNVRHFQRLMLDIRKAIAEDAWSSLPERWPVLATPDPRSGPPAGLGADSPDTAGAGE